MRAGFFSSQARVCAHDQLRETRLPAKQALEVRTGRDFLPVDAAEVFTHGAFMGWFWRKMSSRSDIGWSAYDWCGIAGFRGNHAGELPQTANALFIHMVGHYAD